MSVDAVAPSSALAASNNATVPSPAATSTLRASAKPFTFNPNAKSFVFQSFAPAKPVPMYSGSSLVFYADSHDLSSILLYDPCFDYIAAGLITAVPITEAGNDPASYQPYDMIMDQDATFDSTTAALAKRTSPKKSRISPKKSKRGTAQPSPQKESLNTDGTIDESNPTVTGVEIVAQVVEGAPQSISLAASEVNSDESESDEDYETEEEDEDEDDKEEDGDDEDEEEEGPSRAEGDSEHQPLSSTLRTGSPRSWSPETYSVAGSSTTDDLGVSYQSSQKFYYYNNTSDPFQSPYNPSVFHQGNTSFHADRRRQEQSQYFSSFGSNRSNSPPQYRSSRFALNNNGSYSPPLVAQRRDLYFQQDLHLHMNEFYLKSAVADDAHRRMYTRDTLLDLRKRDECQGKATNLPQYLSDIFKSSSPPLASRSLFGNSAAASSSSSSTAVSRGIFASSLQANTNHNTPGPDSASDYSSKKSKLKGGKKKKKNKDRSARAIEDDDIAIDGRRNRVDSIDDDIDERKESHHNLSVKKGKKGRAPSPKRGKNGKSGRGGNTVESSEFENATLADLHHCENSWSSSIAQVKASADSLMLAEKSARSILNKLSVDKIQALLDSMLEIDIHSHEVLDVIVKVLFDKSVDEPAFAELYARFCSMLAPRMPEFTVDKGDGGNSKHTYSFRTMLLTRCYKLLVEDEESLTKSLLQASDAPTSALKSSTSSPLLGPTPSSLNLTTLELNEKLQLLKCHQKGNLIFIGELFKQNLLQNSVVHMCLDMLLDYDPNDEPSEWDVECVCVFLQTVGQKLDASCEANCTDEGLDQSSAARETRKQLIEGHFKKIQALSKHRGLPSRFRFMLLDLLELRGRKWKPRLQKTVDPQSLSEIREQAQLQTPQASKYGSNAPAATTGGKKASKSVFQQHANQMRTAAKPPQAVYNASSSSSRPSPYQGRSLNFEESPQFIRSSSAPDRHDRTATFSTAPLFSPDATPGKYMPMWKRRELGLDGVGGLLPRSKSDAVHEGDETTGAVVEEGEEESKLLDRPEFDADAVPTLQLMAEEEEEAAQAEYDDGEEEQHDQEEEEEKSSSAFAVPQLSPSNYYPAALIQQKLDDIVGELYSSHDVAEAALCYSELRAHCASHALPAVLAVPLFSKAVEQKQSQRELCSRFMVELLNQQLMTVEQLLPGLKEWFTLLGDVAIDVPHAPTFTFNMLLPLLTGGLLSIQSVLALLTYPVEEGMLVEDQAFDYFVDLMQQLRAALPSKDDEGLVTFLNESLKAEELKFSLVNSLFEKDTERATAALQGKNLACIAPVFIR